MIKDILVHLDGTDDDEWRIAYTGLIARMFQAHVTGLFLHRLTTGSIPVEAGYFDREALEHVITQVRLEGDRIEKRLMNKLFPSQSSLRNASHRRLFRPDCSSRDH